MSPGIKLLMIAQIRDTFSIRFDPWWPWKVRTRSHVDLLNSLYLWNGTCQAWSYCCPFTSIGNHNASYSLVILYLTFVDLKDQIMSMSISAVCMQSTAPWLCYHKAEVSLTASLTLWFQMWPLMVLKCNIKVMWHSIACIPETVHARHIMFTMLRSRHPYKWIPLVV